MSLRSHNLLAHEKSKPPSHRPTDGRAEEGFGCAEDNRTLFDLDADDERKGPAKNSLLFAERTHFQCK